MEALKLTGPSLSRIPFILWLILWFFAVLYIGFIPGQSDFADIVLPYTAAFIAYTLCLPQEDPGQLKMALVAAVLVRIALVFSFPQLSDDVFRFVWDGRLIHEGLNPYAWSPGELVGTRPFLTHNLYDQLNSPNYYTIYPPITQFIFYIGGFFRSAGIEAEVIAQKTCMLLFELGVLKLLYKLLISKGQSPHLLLLYALNPLVVVEIMGNMHHEGILFFFLLMAVWSFQMKKVEGGAVAFTLSIATKMLTLMFVPAILLWLQRKQKWIFIAIVGILVALLFLPLFAAAGNTLNFGTSLDLYFRKFEFNAGIYYILRWGGYLVKGYNIIHILGPVLAISAFVSILFIAWKGRKTSNMSDPWVIFLASFTVYLLLSLTVHPWYVILPVGMCLFTSYRFPIYWSYLIAWTYINYSGPVYNENLVIVALEYGVVYWLIFKEITEHRFRLN